MSLVFNKKKQRIWRFVEKVMTKIFSKGKCYLVPHYVEHES